MTGLKIDGPETERELDRVSTEAENTLRVRASSDKTASVELNRTWTNGWALTAYAKAWWKGERVVGAGGFEVDKKF